MGEVTQASAAAQLRVSIATKSKGMEFVISHTTLLCLKKCSATSEFGEFQYTFHSHEDKD